MLLTCASFKPMSVLVPPPVPATLPKTDTLSPDYTNAALAHFCGVASDPDDTAIMFQAIVSLQDVYVFTVPE